MRLNNKSKRNMDFENEKYTEGGSVERNTGDREGYQPSNRQENYQYRAGRSPRPRFNTKQQSEGGYSRRPSFNRNDNREGGFRPEGFGAMLHNEEGLQRQGYRQHYNGGEGGYRPRNNYNRQEGGYQPRQGGYNNRQRYNEDGQQGYQPRQNYRPRYNEDGTLGYQPRQPREGGYQSNEGGFRPRQNGYGNNRQGGYQPRQQGGYNNRQGGFNNNRKGGYRQRTADYDPNAKYSLKKRILYKEEHYDPNEPMRLNKFLANAGVCSRREADEFIQAGVVTVNGNIVTELGTKILRTDEVKFHDQPVSPEKKVYVLLNKPKDYVTTVDDPQQRKTVMELVKDACNERIYPVGRLDRNTTGVLLLTNDGDLASKLTHPKFLKKKIYHVYLDKNVTAHDLQTIREGLTLEDGEIQADAAEYADATDKKQVGIEIHSGKNRIVRRIFEALGYKVTKLDRVQFAGLTKKNVRRGDWRYLTEEEVDRLRMGAYE